MEKFKLNSAFEILTPNGFENFHGIRKIKKSSYVKLKNYDLICSDSHKIYINDTWVDSSSLEHEQINQEIELYDPVGIESSSYISNDIISHNCDFIGSSNTLISSEKLNALTWVKPMSKTNDGLTIFVDPVKETEMTPLHTYFIVVDVARGQGKDYSALTVIDISQMPYKIVAKYRNNIISPLLFPSIIRSLGKRYNDAYVMVELNDIGSQVADILHTDLEYENLIKSNMRGRKGQIITEGFGSNKSQQLGIRTSQVVKKLGCSVLKNLIENDKLIIEDAEIIEELTTFISTNASFSADRGYNDDMVMTLVLFAWSTRQEFFKNLTNTDVRLEMYELDIKKIEDEMLPFGYIMDGNTELDLTDDKEWSENDKWLIIDTKTQKWSDLYKQNGFF